MLDHSRPNPKPLVFAIMANKSPVVQVVHGFGQMMLEDDSHPCDGTLGCFIGDRSIMEFNGDTVIQDPEFTTFRENNIIEAVDLKLASDGRIKRMGPVTAFIKGSTRGDNF
jgi:hypothetical protein